MLICVSNGQCGDSGRWLAKTHVTSSVSDRWCKARPPNASFASSVPAEAAPDEVYPSNWPLVADTAFIYEHRPQKPFRPVYMAKLECSVGAESFVWVFERVGWCPKEVAFFSGYRAI